MPSRRDRDSVADLLRIIARVLDSNGAEPAMSALARGTPSGDSGAGTLPLLGETKRRTTISEPLLEATRELLSQYPRGPEEFCVVLPACSPLPVTASLEAKTAQNRRTQQRHARLTQFLSEQGASLHLDLAVPHTLLVRAEPAVVALAVQEFGIAAVPRYFAGIAPAYELKYPVFTAFRRSVAQGRDLVGIGPYQESASKPGEWPIGLFDFSAHEEHCVFNGPNGPVVTNLYFDDEQKGLAVAPSELWRRHGTKTCHILSGSSAAGSESVGLTHKPVLCVLYQHPECVTTFGGCPEPQNAFDLWAFLTGAAEMYLAGCRIVCLEIHTPSDIDKHFPPELEDLLFPVMDVVFSTLFEAGMAIVSAAGNHGATRLSWPGCSPWVLSVGAYSRNLVPGHAHPSVLLYDETVAYFDSPPPGVSESGWDGPDLEEFNGDYVTTGHPKGRIKPEIWCPTDTQTAVAHAGCDLDEAGDAYGHTSGATPYAVGAACWLLEYFEQVESKVLTPGELFAGLIAATEMPSRRARWEPLVLQKELEEQAREVDGMAAWYYECENVIQKGFFEDTVKVTGGGQVDPVLGAGYLHLPHPDCSKLVPLAISFPSASQAFSLPLSGLVEQMVQGIPWWTKARVRAAIWWKDDEEAHDDVNLRVLRSSRAGGKVVLAESTVVGSVFQKVDVTVATSGAEAPGGLWVEVSPADIHAPSKVYLFVILQPVE